jgi:hypothetical protein
MDKRNSFSGLCITREGFMSEMKMKTLGEVCLKTKNRDLQDPAFALFSNNLRSFFYLLEDLTANKFYSKKTQERVRRIQEAYPKLKIESIPDNLLEELYSEINEWLRETAKMKYESSGYSQTSNEKIAIKLINEVLNEENSFDNVQIVPKSNELSGHACIGKASIGTHVPDIILEGCSRKGSSMVILEIDDEEVHMNKSKKDETYYRNMENLGIHVYHVYNDQARNKDYLRKILGELTPHQSRDAKDKAQRCLRRIYCYTIGRNCTLENLEVWLKMKGIDIDLVQYFRMIVGLHTCPRRIIEEAKDTGLIKKQERRIVFLKGKAKASITSGN